MDYLRNLSKSGLFFLISEEVVVIHIPCCGKWTVQARDYFSLMPPAKLNEDFPESPYRGAPKTYGKCSPEVG